MSKFEHLNDFPKYDPDKVPQWKEIEHLKTRVAELQAVVDAALAVEKEWYDVEYREDFDGGTVFQLRKALEVIYGQDLPVSKESEMSDDLSCDGVNMKIRGGAPGSGVTVDVGHAANLLSEAYKAIADKSFEIEQLEIRVAELENELEKSKRETDAILTTAERMKKELDDIRVKKEAVTMHDEEGE